jgi:hypothetical protein
MALKTAQLDGPAFPNVYFELVEAAGWKVDDPRLPALADWLVSLIEQEVEELEDRDGFDETGQVDLDDSLVELLDQVFLDTVPIGSKLLALLEERGWTGWTRLERVQRPT